MNINNTSDLNKWMLTTMNFIMPDGAYGIGLQVVDVPSELQHVYFDLTLKKKKKVIYDYSIAICIRERLWSLVLAWEPEIVFTRHKILTAEGWIFIPRNRSGPRLLRVDPSPLPTGHPSKVQTGPSSWDWLLSLQLP